MSTTLHRAVPIRATTAIWIPISCLLVLLMWRIQTYVTGQDPAIYIGLARRLLSAPIGSEDWASALFRLTPGYPLLLAAAIQIGGDLAPYWVNLAFAIGFFYVLGRLVARGHGDGASSAVIVSVCAVVLITGYGLNPHFLLYPFRATACYFFVFLAYLLLARDLDGPRATIRAGASGLFLVAATWIREPMVFASVGAFGWVLSRRGWVRARRDLLFLAAPFLAALVACVIAISLTGRWGTVQGLLIYQAWSGQPALGGVVFWSATGWELVRQVGAELTWVGVFFLAAGLWFERRRSSTWWLYIVPAVLLLAFYAFLVPHRRYTLSILVFLSPMVGSGVAGWLSRFSATAARSGRAWAGQSLYAVALVVCLSLLARSVWRQQPWGPRATREEVRAFQTDIAAFASPGDVIYSEWACRRLGDAVQSFTRQTPAADPRGINLVWRSGQTGFYLNPLNDTAYVAEIQDRYHVSVERLIRHRADLVPVRDDAGAPRVVQIAGGRFGVHEIVPWSELRVRQRVRGRQGKTLVVWLDLQSAGMRGTGTVRVVDPDGNALVEANLVPGNGIQAVVVPADKMTLDEVVLELDADRPIPMEPVYAVCVDKTPVDFELTYDRSPSVYAWFQPPFVPIEKERKYVAMFSEGGSLCLPPCLGADARIEALLVLTPGPNRAGPIRTSYSRDGESLGVFENTLEDHRFYHGFTTEWPSGQTVCIDLQVEPAGCHGGHVRVNRIRLRAAVLNSGEENPDSP